MERDLIGEMFSQKEQDVSVLMSSLPENVAEATSAEEFEKSYKVGAPELKEEIVGLISIDHGWAGDDYVWHIKPAHSRRPWKVRTDQVIQACAAIMTGGCIGKKNQVDVFLPQGDWDIKEITFKAHDLKSDWAVTEPDIVKTTENLFSELNRLV